MRDPGFDFESDLTFDQKLERAAARHPIVSGLIGLACMALIWFAICLAFV